MNTEEAHLILFQEKLNFQKLSTVKSSFKNSPWILLQELSEIFEKTILQSGVLYKCCCEKLGKVQTKTPVLRCFSNKVAGLQSKICKYIFQLLQICFSVNFVKLFKIYFLKRTPTGCLLSNLLFFGLKSLVNSYKNTCSKNQMNQSRKVRVCK